MWRINQFSVKTIEIRRSLRVGIILMSQFREFTFSVTMEFGFFFVDTKEFDKTLGVDNIKTEHKPCPHTAEQQYKNKSPDNRISVFAHSGTKVGNKRTWFL